MKTLNVILPAIESESDLLKKNLPRLLERLEWVVNLRDDVVQIEDILDDRGLPDDAGFEILKITGGGLFGSIRDVYPSLLTGDLCVKARKM